MKHARVSHLTVAKMLAYWVDNPSTPNELADVCGLHVITVSRFVRAIHKEKRAHIIAWEKDAMGRTSTRKVYAFGHGKDAPKPKPTPKAVTQQRYKAKRAQMAMQNAIAGLAA